MTNLENIPPSWFPEKLDETGESPLLPLAFRRIVVAGAPEAPIMIHVMVLENLSEKEQISLRWRADDPDADSWQKLTGLHYWSGGDPFAFEQRLAPDQQYDLTWFISLLSSKGWLDNPVEEFESKTYNVLDIGICWLNLKERFPGKVERGILQRLENLTDEFGKQSIEPINPTGIDPKELEDLFRDREESRLDQKPNDFLLQRFDESRIEFIKWEGIIPGGPHHPSTTGYFGKNEFEGVESPFDIQIYMVSQEHEVPIQTINNTKVVLQNLVAMDSKIRSQKFDWNQFRLLNGADFEIGYISVGPTSAELNYACGFWGSFVFEIEFDGDQGCQIIDLH